MRPLYAGAMHYWRVEPAAWPACLRAIHELGFTHVETPIPWRVHEPARGDFDWTGERDAAKLIELARSIGLGVIVRPGPNVGAELTSFGIPDWVLAEPACRAVTSRGTPAWFPAPPRAFPIPSQASGAFRAHVRTWFAELARVVPHDVAIGIDRSSFFRDAAFDLDYHPDAIGWFGEAPPRAWDRDDAARCIRWVQFRERYEARARREVADELRGLGFANIVELGAISYAPRGAFRDLRREGIATIGIGGVPWLPPQPATGDDPTLDRDRVLSHLAAGAQGIALAMAVDRERSFGAAIDRDGRVRAPWIKPLLGALVEHDWPSLRRRASIAVLDVAADRRFGTATSLVDPLAPVVADLLGLGAANLGSDAGAIAMRRWQLAVRRALELAQVAYEVVDERTPADELARFAAVIAPTLERIDRVAWHDLRSLADAKRCVVVIGPGTPTRDEFDQPLDEPAARRMGRLEPGSLDDLPGLAEALAALAGDSSEAWQVERPSSVRSTVFIEATGTAKLVIVQADAHRPVTATLLADPQVTHLRDALTNELIAVRDGRVTLAITGARMLVVS
jgi:Glycosyl hydrolases family 35